MAIKTLTYNLSATETVRLSGPESDHVKWRLQYGPAVEDREEAAAKKETQSKSKSSSSSKSKSD